MSGSTLIKQFIEIQKEDTPLDENKLSYFKQLDARIKHCRREDKAHASLSNCVGTGLFLVGLQEKDVYARVYEVQQLKQLQKAQTPELGGLVSWEEDVCGRLDIDHLAVVTHIDPVLLTHREGFSEKLLENQPFEEVVKAYKINPRIKVIFYMPEMTMSSINSKDRQQSVQEKKELEEGRACKAFLSELLNSSGKYRD
jgi:hypothetical protein